MPRRRGGRAAAGGATCSISTAPPTFWSPKSVPTGFIPGGPTKGQFVGRFGRMAQVLGRFRVGRAQQRRLAANDVRRRSADGPAVRPGACGGLVRGDPDLIITAASARRRGAGGSACRHLATDRRASAGHRAGDASAVAQSSRRSAGWRAWFGSPRRRCPTETPTCRSISAATPSRWAAHCRRAVGRLPTGACFTRRGAPRPPIQPARPRDESGGPDRAAARLAPGRRDDSRFILSEPIGRRSSISGRGACGRSRRRC